MSVFYPLDPTYTDPKRMKKEREKAKKLKLSQWWKIKIQKGECKYCQKTFSPSELTMDHLVPLARGGRSTRGNIVAACQECNRKKKLNTPVDQILNPGI